jgi:hypothetical protein
MNSREAPDNETAEPLTIHVPADTSPVLIAMMRRLLAMYDPQVAHPPLRELQ